ncbi:hypothetical protein T09_10206 [Trichinella sp. T9]|nr:hypothetical protein T09_10206 [Trichinella sp. T9]
MVVGVRCVVRVQGRFPYNEVNVHLKTQEWKMDVNDRKTAISLVSITLFYHLAVAYFNYVASK